MFYMSQFLNCPWTLGKNIKNSESIFFSSFFANNCYVVPRFKYFSLAFAGFLQKIIAKHVNVLFPS